MSRTLRALPSAGLVLAVLFLSTASPAVGGPFGRIWERRKAELRGELSSELNANLNANLAQEMEAARAELSAAATAQIKEEAKQLQATVSQELATLRQEAQAAVAAEAARLDEQVKLAINEMRAEARKIVADESKKLADEVAQATQTLRDSVQNQMNQVPQLVSTQVQDQLAKWKAEQQPAAPGPQPEPKTPADESALPSQPVQIRDESAGDTGTE